MNDETHSWANVEGEENCRMIIRMGVGRRAARIEGEITDKPKKRRAGDEYILYAVRVKEFYLEGVSPERKTDGAGGKKVGKPVTAPRFVSPVNGGD